MEDYTILGRIGEGAHGIVMKARHRKTGTIVALKKVLLKRLEDGLPETALREIKALQVLTISRAIGNILNKQYIQKTSKITFFCMPTFT